MNATPAPFGDPARRHLVRQESSLRRADRVRVTRQRGAVLWFTGLSGSGKSTVAGAVEARLNRLDKVTFLLDGDNVRHGLCADLGFGDADRRENIRRVAHVARLFWEANLLALVSFISPFRADRRIARDLIGSDFVEIFVDAPLAICEARDPKGLYRKARDGLIAEFTGISSPYEPPEAPELTLKTGAENLDTCVEQVLAYLKSKGYLLS